MPGPPGGGGDVTAAVNVCPFAVIVCASTTKRLKAAGLLTPVKEIREPSLMLARSGSPVSGEKRQPSRR
jgi:hypothetical protein